MRLPLRLLVLVLFAVPAVADVVTVPMNQQINLGYTYNSQSPNGDAIYPAFNSDTQTIYPDGALEPEGFTRHNLVTVPGGWYYQYLDLNLAGITIPGDGLDLSASDVTLSFDVRYYQDPNTNSNPYGDAPVFLRLYTYGADGNTYLGNRDFGIVYATQSGDPPYPDWTTVTVNVNLDPFTDGGTFDITDVSRIRWYGTDWSGGGDDFVDFKNVVITPEPASLIPLLAGLLLVLRRR